MKKILLFLVVLMGFLYASPTIFKTPKEALENFGAYVEKGTKNSVTIFEFYAGESKDVMDFYIKRDIVKGFLISFINTKVKKLTLTVNIREFPKKQFIKTAFKGTLRKKDALKVAKKLLHINSLDKLVGNYIPMNGENVYMKDAPNQLFNQIIYNDQGGVTLNVFYRELSKYIK